MNTPPVEPLRAPRITSGAVALTGMCLMVALAARTSGAGWLIVLLCLLAGALAVGLIGPWIGLIGVRGHATGPADATAGVETTVAIELRRSGLGMVVRGTDGPWAATAPGVPAVVAIVPSRRGLLDALDVEVRCGAPFGLAWHRRRLTVPLQRTIVVAPRTASGDGATPTTDGTPGERAGNVAATGAELRSVRDYVPGDPLRMVHWPATARRDELVVKELDAPQRRRLYLLVHLIGDIDADERAAEQAMGIAVRALAAGELVTLATARADGPHRAEVTDRVEAGRQLALAGPGRPPEPDTADGPCVRVSAGQS